MTPEQALRALIRGNDIVIGRNVYRITDGHLRVVIGEREYSSTLTLDGFLHSTFDRPIPEVA